MEQRIVKLLKEMTLEEKIALCSGKDFWHTKEFEKYEIPSIMMADGPHGLRKQKDSADMLGINDAVLTTCFPTAVTMGATWDRALIGQVAKAIGEEAKEEDVPVVLGPGVNIKRNPLCGRNFEYFSEDPLVAGEMGTAYVKGMQTHTGIGTSLKHFAANNQEYKRFSSDSQLDERTLREIYLTGFEMVVKEAQPKTVMCAYDKINGTYCSDHKGLLTDILREEWGYQGMVVTDWGAMNDRIKSFQAGCDLSMPGGSSYMEAEAKAAIEQGTLNEEEVDICAKRVLELVLHGQKVLEEKGTFTYDRKAHQKLAEQCAADGMVLLKNDNGILPIVSGKKVAMIGYMASKIRYQGAGSSHINPTKLVNVTDALKGTILQDALCIEGCDAKGRCSGEQLQEVTKTAAKAEIAIVFVGLTEQFESEGFDRDTMQLPEGHNAMVEAALEGNPNTVVVLMGGSAMLFPWKEKVKAILYTGLCGQSGGTAIVNVLTGKVNPSGKLTETWPMSEEDVPSYGFYAGKRKNAQYREGIYVGYRYYEKAHKQVNFPFGYGLSYTTFEYSDLKVEEVDKEQRNYRVTVRIKNSGNCDGGEVVELYVSNPQDGIHRPLKELRGFEKVFLKAGESREVTMELYSRSFSVYDNGWKIPKGTYQIMVGSSSAQILLQQPISIDGTTVSIPDWQSGSWYENPKGQPQKADWEKLMGHKVSEDEELKKGNFTINHTLLELKDYNFIAKIMCKSIETQIAKGMGIKPDYSVPEFRMSAMSSVDCSMRGINISSCGQFSMKLAKAIVEMANGHKLKGLKELIKK